MSTLAQMHTVTVSVRKDVITTVGSTQAQTVIHGFDVACDCGWQSFYSTLAEANEACGRHGRGLPVDVAAEPTEQQQRQAREEFDRIRARMLETGDPYCE